MQTLTNKRILLGITGGIAAYKSADLIRRLRDQGAEVQVIMTKAACEFITPLTMQALSGKPVHIELLDPVTEAGMGHIELARWSDVIVVAPATANFIARLSHGMADDLLSAICLVAAVPILIAPAMNQQMWLNAATQANIQNLAARGIILAGPASGMQACGETGPGRMLEPLELVAAVNGLFETRALDGKHVLVTAGPTQEAIDPVRFISNRSSGRMGYAIARAAQEAGAEVTLVSGPTAIPAPERVKYVPVKTAEQMREAVLAQAAKQDIFIAAAAVADYRCAEIAGEKIKKTAADLVLTLRKNPDILAEVAQLPRPPYTVGFAAETTAVKENALIKLRSKGLDMIAANRVGDGLGFESDENSLEVLWDGGTISLELTSKDKLARQLIDIVARKYNEKHPPQSY
ncbi:MAG: phosphopantothenoylcysteine decarboxylase/phosphopantothenate/cysteine ligase [Gammaproteobacteria bacterium]|nr:phosphopantothenoylcysteine decarboxylase/phosphopantothenate/cysteine ligase [Gammaproteobacteria bacterium]